MHAAGLVNADLKPENALLRAPAGQAPGSCPEVALCDFGSAFSETETDTAKLSFEMQTLPYRSPEVDLHTQSIHIKTYMVDSFIHDYNVIYCDYNIKHIISCLNIYSSCPSSIYP